MVVMVAAINAQKVLLDISAIISEKNLSTCKTDIKMIYAYIRVSTDKQDNENQRLELTRWAEREGWKIDKWVAETVSGTKDYHQRVLSKLLKKTEKGDRIICSELSRLARKYLMLMEILSICQTRGIEVWTRKGDYKLGDNIQSQVLAFAFKINFNGLATHLQAVFFCHKQNLLARDARYADSANFSSNVWHNGLKLPNLKKLLSNLR